MSPQPIITVERVLTWLLTAGGFGLTIWLIKRQLCRMETTLDKQEQNYHACREELPDRFAAKEETKGNITRLWERTDKHAEDIAHAQGLRNAETQE